MPGRWVRWNEDRNSWEISSNDGGKWYPLIENHRREFEIEKYVDIVRWTDDRPVAPYPIVEPESYDFEGLAGVVVKGPRTGMLGSAPLDEWIRPTEIRPPFTPNILPPKRNETPGLSSPSARATSRIYFSRVAKRLVISENGGIFRELAFPIESSYVRRTTDWAHTVSATWIPIPFDVDYYNNFGMHDTAVNNTRITALAGGMYRIGGQVTWAANATGIRGLSVYLNGTTFMAVQALTATATVIHLNLMTEFILNVGDYVELQGYQDSGGNLNVLSVASTGHPYTPRFWAQRCA